MKKEFVFLLVFLVSLTFVFALPPPPPNPGLPIEEEVIFVEVPVETPQLTQQEVSAPLEEKPANVVEETLPVKQTEDVVPDVSAKSNVLLQQPESNNNLILISGVSMIVIMCVVVLLAVRKQKPSSAPNKQLAQAVQNPQFVQLRNYVVQSLQQGYTKEQISAHLLQHGYQKQMIDEVFKYV